MHPYDGRVVSNFIVQAVAPHTPLTTPRPLTTRGLRRTSYGTVQCTPVMRTQCELGSHRPPAAPFRALTPPPAACPAPAPLPSRGLTP